MSEATRNEVVSAEKPAAMPFHHHLAAVQVMFHAKGSPMPSAMPVNVVFTTTDGVINGRDLQEIGIMGQKEFFRGIPQTEQAQYEVFRTAILDISYLGLQSMENFAGVTVGEAAEAPAAANDGVGTEA